ncbi:MAG: ATP-dependent Clp protease adaptor ClpS [Planctomycetota bacterium]|nr:ATP-dependent Clp protease adaptor ClpS [Planctomycetota bacterium]
MQALPEEVEGLPSAPATAKPSPRPIVRTRPQPPFAVVLHDDPVNTFEYVVGVLMWVLRCGKNEAFDLTLRAHRTGKSVIWAGTKEHAELKAGQIRSCGPDPATMHRGARPLGVHIEEMPAAC